jgi:hypothetical protein
MVTLGRMKTQTATPTVTDARLAEILSMLGVGNFDNEHERYTSSLTHVELNASINDVMNRYGRALTIGACGQSEVVAGTLVINANMTAIELLRDAVWELHEEYEGRHEDDEEYICSGCADALAGSKAN